MRKTAHTSITQSTVMMRVRRARSFGSASQGPGVVGPAAAISRCTSNMAWLASSSAGDRSRGMSHEPPVKWGTPPALTWRATKGDSPTASRSSHSSTRSGTGSAGVPPGATGSGTGMTGTPSGATGPTTGSAGMPSETGSAGTPPGKSCSAASVSRGGGRGAEAPIGGSGDATSAAALDGANLATRCSAVVPDGGLAW